MINYVRFSLYTGWYTVKLAVIKIKETEEIYDLNFYREASAFRKF